MTENNPEGDYFPRLSRAMSREVRTTLLNTNHVLFQPLLDPMRKPRQREIKCAKGTE